MAKYNYTNSLHGLFFMLAVLFSTVLISQNNLFEYTGKVIDAKSKMALGSVSLGLSNSNITTVTNTEGNFVLKVPAYLKNNTLRIVFLGYATKVINLNVNDLDLGTMALEPMATQLSEVNISTFKNAKNLVRNVLNNKDKTLQNEPVMMRAFYRETIKRRNRNVALTEAVVNVLKQPYTTPQSDIIELDKSRKSTDYKRLDTLSVKLQGGPFSTIYLDLMKYPEYIFPEDNIDRYEFSFSAPSTIDNRNVYVVDFKPKANELDLGYYGRLFIDVTSLALVSANYSLDVSDTSKTRNFFVRKKPKNVVVYPLEANYRVDYNMNGGKWHFAYAKLNLKFKVNKKRELFNKVYTLSSEMAVTDLDFNISENAIKKKDRLKPTVILGDAASGFSDPDFWGQYNLIEPDKSIEFAIQKIKKNTAKTAADNL